MPYCFAVPSDEGLCIVVESQLHLFDVDCSEHKATITLGNFFEFNVLYSLNLERFHNQNKNKIK